MGRRAGRGLALALALLGCGGENPAAAPDPTPLGPEALTVTLVRRPDTVAVGGHVDVTVTVRNATRRPVRTVLRCPAGGLALRVLAADGALHMSAPAVCRSVSVDPRVYTFAPGDSVAVPVSFSTVVPGRYRVRAVYEAENGAAPPAELPLVVRAP
jgi:hypothetical protein